ncbi:uncharacterized protein [Taeniopygia guttata]|uniref:uncharacterized protein n=1 Tax=Taeniopygia guttata TaxID=59729 RepID=UPI003BB936AF
MFSSSFFTASGLLVPAMAPPGRPRAGRCSERAGAAPVSPSPGRHVCAPHRNPPARPRPLPAPRPPRSHNAGRRQLPHTRPGAGRAAAAGREGGREGGGARTRPAQPGRARPRERGSFPEAPSPQCRWVCVKRQERRWDLARGGGQLPWGGDKLRRSRRVTEEQGGEAVWASAAASPAERLQDHRGRSSPATSGSQERLIEKSRKRDLRYVVSHGHIDIP